MRIVRWLVIGIGDITRRRVLPAILDNSRCRLEALVTRDPEKALAYPSARAFRTLDEALLQAEIDAVYVASPVYLHAPQTVASLQAGKHVLCEKPTALNFAEAEIMVKAARDSRRLLAVAYYRRLFPKLIRARQLIQEGVVGDPVLAEANCHSWLDIATLGENRNWMLKPRTAGGGPLYDIASHRIDAMNFLFGTPAHATGVISNRIHALAVEDSATVVILYAQGIHAVVDARWNSHIKRDQFRVIGTDGEMNLDPLSGPELRYAGHSEFLPTHPNVHSPCIDNFVSAILDGSPLACPGDDAVETDQVISMALKACEKTFSHFA